MRPTLRIVDDAEVGAIAGNVDSALVTDGCLPKVYVFSGSGVTPDDIEEASGADADPLVVASVAVAERQHGLSVSRGLSCRRVLTRSLSLASDDDARRTTRWSSTGRRTSRCRRISSATADFAAPASLSAWERPC
jgi:hypothetical protein